MGPDPPPPLPFAQPTPKERKGKGRSGERRMGTTAYGGRGSKGRAAHSDRPIGGARCRREQHTKGDMPTPPPPLLSCNACVRSPPVSSTAFPSPTVFQALHKPVGDDLSAWATADQRPLPAVRWPSPPCTAPPTAPRPQSCPHSRKFGVITKLSFLGLMFIHQL